MYVGRNRYLSCITMVRIRAVGVGPEQPGDSFRMTVSPTRPKSVPFLTDPKGDENRRTHRHSLPVLASLSGPLYGGRLDSA